MHDREIVFEDLRLAKARQDPAFASLVISYVAQDDPPEDRPELFNGSDKAPKPPEDSWTLKDFKSRVSKLALKGKTAEEQRAIRRNAWEKLLESPYYPPRLALGDLLIEVYEQRTAWSYQMLTEIFSNARMGFGIWKAFKYIFKKSEENYDAIMFGVLVCRLECMLGSPRTDEVSLGTVTYLQRRAWRYLRQLGQSVPELYPVFAVELLSNYRPEESFSCSWVAHQIWAHKSLFGQRSASGTYYLISRWKEGLVSEDFEIEEEDEIRAFPDIWKQSPDPLVRLLADAQNATVCEFAILYLKVDHRDFLRDIDIEWLKLLSRKSISQTQEFVVELLELNKQILEIDFAKLGLEESILEYLKSESKKVRAYAINYARARPSSMGTDLLLELASQKNYRESHNFAIEVLTDKAADSIPLLSWAGLLEHTSSRKLAQQKIQTGYTYKDITKEYYVKLKQAGQAQSEMADSLFELGRQKVPAEYLKAVVDDSRSDNKVLRSTLKILGQYRANEIGIDWIKETLMKPSCSQFIASWLRQKIIPAKDLDVVWLKNLVFNVELRDLAIELMEARDYVEPSKLGLSWLLSLLTRPEPELSEFASKYLLTYFEPADFESLSSSSGHDNKQASFLWQLVLSKNTLKLLASLSQLDGTSTLGKGLLAAQAVRSFAALYLQVHHPRLGPTMYECREYGITPRLGDDAYTYETITTCLDDERLEVRNLGIAICTWDIVRFNDSSILYSALNSPHKEPRQWAGRLMLRAGEPDKPDRAPAIPMEYLLAEKVIPLTESMHRQVRLLAVSLIRKHYDLLGGAQRLVWLMQSADKSVRFFAVRMFWEKHRPGIHPQSNYRHFDSTESLQEFLRIVLYGVPSGRGEHLSSGQEEGYIRRISASVGKKRLIEVIQSLAQEDKSFAETVIPVFQTFLHSKAKGEWQACLSALAHIKSSHSDLNVGLNFVTKEGEKQVWL